jgi:hypothetical protein
VRRLGNLPVLRTHLVAECFRIDRRGTIIVFGREAHEHQIAPVEGANRGDPVGEF